MIYMKKEAGKERRYTTMSSKNGNEAFPVKI